MGQSSSTGNELCLKPACLHASSHIIQNLAQNWEKIDPCTDFYELACGGTRERWEEGSSTASSIQDRTLRIIRNVIESPYEDAVAYHSIMIRNNIDEQNFRMLQQDYQSCMNVEAIAAAGTSPLLKLIADFTEIWPINPDDTSTLDSSEYGDLHHAITFLEQLLIPTFKGLASKEGPLQLLAPDPRDPVIMYPYVEPSRLSLKSPEAYEDAEQVESHVKEVAQKFEGGLLLGGKNISSSQAESLAKGVVEFETKLAGALIAAQNEDAVLQQANPEDLAATYFKVPFDEFASLAPALGLDKVILSMAPSGHTPEAVIMRQRSFFANASSIVESSPKTVIQSWMVWRIVSQLEDEVSVPTAAAAPRWKQCIIHSDQTMRWVLNRYFVSASYTDGMRDVIEKITTNVQTAIVNRFSELDWMTDEVKARAIAKAQNMVHNIGYPSEDPDLHSPSALAAYYQGLNITDEYFSNVLTARLHKVKATYAGLGKPVSRSEWTSPPIENNAGYMPSTNAIFINAGGSQPVLFHPDLPSYILYGATGGSYIGHEITHGFDNRGHRFDERGAFKSWFDNSTSAAYAERAQCFVEEFGKFEYPVSTGKQKLNGEATLGENISDVGGLRLGFEAWKALSGDEKNNQKLPGLENFTFDQLFFLSWANGYCSRPTPADNDIFITDVHSPDRIRIMGGTEHSRAFKEAWNCPNKEPKCELF